MKMIDYLQIGKNIFSNRSNSSDEEIEKAHETACYLNLVFSAIGIFFNFISIFVFSQEKLRKNKFNWYLLTLSVFELIFCVIIFTDYIFREIYKEGIFLHGLNKITGLTIDFIIHLSDSSTTLLTLFLSLDRLYAVKKPMKIKEFVTNLHAKKLMIISLISLISLKFLSVLFCQIEIDRNTHLICCSLVSPLLFNIIPSLIILILNIWLVREVIVYIRKKERPNVKELVRKSVSAAMMNLTNYRKSEHDKSCTSLNLRRFSNKKTTKKLHYAVILVSSIWSMLTSIPYYTVNPYFSLNQFEFFSINFNLKSVIVVQIVSSVIFNLNHCINFFIYFSFYDDFRRALKNLFCNKFLKDSQVENTRSLIRNHHQTQLSSKNKARLSSQKQNEITVL